MSNGFKQIERGDLYHFEGGGMIYDEHIEKEINYTVTIANIQIRKSCRKRKITKLCMAHLIVFIM